MKRLVLLALYASFILTACVITPAPVGYEAEVAPPLPPVVELGVEPYYFHSGFYYFYDNDRWRYSRARGGPWQELPRSHWPKEIRRGGGGEHRGGEFRHEHEER